MNQLEEIAAFAFVLAVVALFNWLTGDRSFRGRELVLRRGAFWLGCRWFGLGLWSASVVATSPNDLLLECAGLLGSLILLLGTARKTLKDDAQRASRGSGRGWGDRNRRLEAARLDNHGRRPQIRASNERAACRYPFR